MPEIHPTAIIAPSATIAENVRIGPYCHVGPNVILGNHITLHSHVVINGHTRLGDHTEVFPFTSLGLAPQDLKYHGEASRLEIGAHTTIREHVTMNPGTEGGGMLTRVGNHCLFMVGAHVAHDCRVGDHVILANNATLAGHVTVGDHAVIGGLAAIHQFVRIGEHAMIGGMSGVERDVIPFGSVLGERANLGGLNLVGLKRRNFSRDEIHALRNAYRTLFSEEGNMADRLNYIAQDAKQYGTIQTLISFLRTKSKRSICWPKNTASTDVEAA